MSIRGIIVGMSLFFMCMAALQAEPFFDDFSGGVADWGVRTSGTVDTTAAGGVFEITNTGENPAILKHKADFSDFSFSVSVKSHTADYFNLGIGFCVQSNLLGYYFVIYHTQVYTLFKHKTDPANANRVVSELLCVLPSGFLRPDSNALSVVKNGASIHLYANDRLLKVIDDPEPLSGGSVALYVPPGTKAEFDDAEVRETTALPYQPSCFTTGFEEQGLWGWFPGFVDGTVEKGEGTLTLRTSASTDLQSALVTNGDYAGSSVRAVIRRVSGSSAGIYGVTLANIYQKEDFSYSYTNFAFVINSEKYHTIVTPEATGSITLLRDDATPIHGGTAFDTIDVRHQEGKFKLFVNDSFVVQASERPEHIINAVGLFADPDLVLECTEFTVARADSAICWQASSTGPLVPAFPYSFLQNAGVAKTLFDMRGRHAAAFSRLPSAAAGVYVVSPGHANVRRLIRLTPR